MSSLLNYYLDQNKIQSANDLGTDHPLTINKKNHIYVTDNPNGWYFDLGTRAIAKRPVWKQYHVGSPTCLTPSNYVQGGDFGCRQPYFGSNCK